MIAAAVIKDFAKNLLKYNLASSLEKMLYSVYQATENSEFVGRIGLNAQYLRFKKNSRK